MGIELEQYSHIGGRQENQDAMGSWIEGNCGLFVVADGLGGHESGQLLARGLCNAIVDAAALGVGPALGSLRLFRQLLEDAVRASRRHILKTCGTPDTHTTVAVAGVTPDSLCFAHVGDTRIYFFSREQLVWRSRDDSLVQLLVEQGMITEQEMASHPLQNQLLKSLSLSGDVRFALTKIARPKTGGLLVLCTDGFWETVSQDEMHGLAGAVPPTDRVRQLVLEAVSRNGVSSDNVSAQAIWIPPVSG